MSDKLVVKRKKYIYIQGLQLFFRPRIEILHLNGIQEQPKSLFMPIS